MPCFIPTVIKLLFNFDPSWPLCFGIVHINNRPLGFSTNTPLRPFSTYLDGADQCNVVLDELREDEEVRVGLVEVQLVDLLLHLSQLRQGPRQRCVLLGVPQHRRGLGERPRVGCQLCGRHSVVGNVFLKFYWVFFFPNFFFFFCL